MEYCASVCFLSAVFTSRWVGDIKFSNPSRSTYNRQERHAVIIFYIYKSIYPFTHGEFNNPPSEKWNT